MSTKKNISYLNSERDFSEDFSIKNGTYFHHCSQCNEHFMGHKHRKICKVCTAKQPKSVTLMSTTNTNDPAFPRPHTVADANDPFFKAGASGMTLRQYYAGEALKGLLANPQLVSWTGNRIIDSEGEYINLDKGDQREALVFKAFQLADAMVAMGNQNAN
jgi:hypothetical protein